MHHPVLILVLNSVLLVCMVVTLVCQVLTLRRIRRTTRETLEKAGVGTSRVASWVDPTCTFWARGQCSRPLNEDDACRTCAEEVKAKMARIDKRLEERSKT